MKLLEALDSRVLRIERALCVLALALMAGVMAASVAHRVFSRPEGRLATGLLAILHALGRHPDAAVVQGPVATTLNGLLCLGLAYLAARSFPRPLSRRKSLVFAAIVSALGALAIWALVTLLPSGLVWAPAVALACMLWAGLLGASIAAAQGRHLSLEVGKHLWPVRHRRVVRTAGLLLAGATSALLCALACVSVHEHWQTWATTPDAATLLPTGLPLWLVLAILPWSFAMMALRFLRQALPGHAERRGQTGPT